MNITLNLYSETQQAQRILVNKRSRLEGDDQENDRIGSTCSDDDQMDINDSDDENQIVDVEGFMLMLPKEVWVHILGYLSEKDLFNCSYVNSFLYNLSQDNFLWKPLYLKKWSVVTLPHRKTLHSMNISKPSEAGSGSFDIMFDNTYSLQSQPLHQIQKQRYYSHKLSKNNHKYIYNIYKPKLNIFDNEKLKQKEKEKENNNNNNNNNYQYVYNKMFWKFLYKERKEIVRDGGIEEFYQLVSTLIVFPLEFNRKAMMTMYTIVFQLCIMNYKIKNYYLPPLDLYRMLVECCHNYLLKLLNDSIFIPDGPALIQYYIYHWQNYLHAIKRINIVFRYYHRDWISKQQEEISSMRPFHTQPVKGSLWWKKLLTDNPQGSSSNSVVHLTTMMARGWISVFFLGLQVNDSFNENSSVDGSENGGNGADSMEMDDPNRLISSLEMCSPYTDFNVIYRFLISIYQLQEFLVFIGDEIPNLNSIPINNQQSPSQQFHPPQVNHGQGNIGANSLSSSPNLSLFLSSDFNFNVNNNSNIFGGKENIGNVLNILSNNPNIRCDEEMNRVAKKCYSFLCNHNAQ